MTDLRKKRIRQRFSRAASTYDDHADVQKELMGSLTAELPQGIAPGQILEIGCGTGNFTAVLAGLYPEAKIVGLDFSENMVRIAREKLSDRNNVSFLCEDGERFLASCPASFDLICSNSTMQWFDDISLAFRQISRLLFENGHFVGALFGPRTFYELALGLSNIYGEPALLPPHRFPDQERLESVVSASLKEASVREVLSVRHYGSLIELLDHIRKTGTGGGQQQPGSFTRGRLSLLDGWFQEKFAGYHATYQAFVVKGKK